MEKSKIDIFAIEKVISTHPAIEKAVVTVDEKTDELEIIAYYIATGNPIDIDNLRQFLKNKIDSKLIPQKLLQVSQFPYDANNEIIRDKLKRQPIIYDADSIEDGDEIVDFILEQLTQITSGQVLFDDLKQPFQKIGVNSLVFIDLVVALEDKFNFLFPDEMLDLEMFHNFAEIIQYIKSLLEEGETN